LLDRGWSGWRKRPELERIERGESPREGLGKVKRGARRPLVREGVAGDLIMAEWILYDVCLSLLPIPLVLLGTWLINTPRGLFAIIRDGQLCFYCTTLGAVAIRDVTKLARPGQPIAVWLAGILFCLILATFTYGIAVTIESSKHEDEHKATYQFRLGIASLWNAVSTTIIVGFSRFIFVQS
jgi:hypothetical protein